MSNNSRSPWVTAGIVLGLSIFSLLFMLLFDSLTQITPTTNGEVSAAATNAPREEIQSVNSMVHEGAMLKLPQDGKSEIAVVVHVADDTSRIHYQTFSQYNRGPQAMTAIGIQDMIERGYELISYSDEASEYAKLQYQFLHRDEPPR